MKYFIKTFGCQMNHSDSERICGFLETKGYKSARNLSEASLVVFNTCGVRQMAEDRVYGQIHNIRKTEAKYPKLIPKIIVLTGCLADRVDAQKRLKDKVDLFFPISNFKKFENFIIGNSLKIENLKLKIPGQNKSTLTKENISYLSINPKHTNTYQAYVPIMTGCDNFCSYCVVPNARGREISRPIKEIIAEVKNLIEKGYKEIILLGQNVNSYRDKKINFSQMITKIDGIPGNFWIRFMSNHPKDVTEEMIESVTKLQKVCECFHLPIQAGNDEILKKMNRKYAAKKYLKMIDKIKASYKKYKPDTLYSITSDIIVGFPGESKKQFLDSAKIMKLVKYDMVFFGQFSPRLGTAAWKMKDDVRKNEKVRREKFLNEILKKTTFANNKKYIGQNVEVLIENKKGEFYFGRTRTGKNVKVTIADCHPELVEGSGKLIGKIMPIKITKANIWNLEGKIK